MHVTAGSVETLYHVIGALLSSRVAMIMSANNEMSHTKRPVGDQYSWLSS